MATSSATSFDPLDLQDLWPLTTDLVDATQSATASMSALARSLSEDPDAGAAPLRQQLLEIRARLVYLLAEIVYAVITHTSTLIASGAILMSHNLQHEPPDGLLTALESQWARVLKACVKNRESLSDCISAWAAFYPVLCDYRLSRSRHPGPVASFLRALGVFGPESTAQTATTEIPSTPEPDSPTQTGLQSMMESLVQIEAFWRKRQSLFLPPGDGFRPERLAHGHRIWAKLAELHPSFNDQFYTCINNLRIIEPMISKYPFTLSDSIDIGMARIDHRMKIGH
ncbi:hypothetical protein AURDEDRAFT_162336 [Auricularia subglabra TFB-10046 SS5]|nr:hypothetical protein AURDEDRAFT_162336 [Auricularia subglabra TFB-10046 SS5]